MKDKHIITMLPDYLDNQLDPVQKEAVDKHLETCNNCQKELEAYKRLFDAINKEKKEEVPDRLQLNFEAMLEEEKAKTIKVVPITANNNSKTKASLPYMLKIAAGFALLIASFFLGKYQNEQVSNQTLAQMENEQREIRQMAMLSLMENKSASKRIQGVNYIEELAMPNEIIVKALAERMLYDENTNVRLTAVEALGAFTNSKTVVNAFVTALGIEKDPGIQIVIIHTLVQLQEKKAIAPLQKLLEEEETQPFIKAQIESLLPKIS